MAVNTGAFMGVFYLGTGDTAIYCVLVIISGIGFGATLDLPSAIQADVIDYHELKTGRWPRRKPKKNRSLHVENRGDEPDPGPNSV